MFESAPDAYLVLAADPPRFTMLAANAARLLLTMTRREDVVGHSLFDVFPDNPDDPQATGVSNLRASLLEVLRTGKPHRMALQRYDIRRPDGAFEERYWEPLNSPVFDEQGTVVAIIHRVEDVTEQVRSGSRLRILESVVTTANDAVVVADPQAQPGQGCPIVYVNEAFTRMTGYAPEEIIGRTASILQGPGTDRDAVARIATAMERREPVRVELLNYRKDGSPFWVELSITPVLDENGNVVQWTSVQRDTSARKAAEASALQLVRETAARAEEARARIEIEEILDSITDAFFAVDRQWRFKYVNQRAEEILQWRREDIIGKSLWEVFPGVAGTVFDREYHRAMEEQTTAAFEAFYEPFGIWVETRAYPTPERLSIYVRDISPRKRAEQALRESEERYRLLADMIPQNIWTTDADGHHRYFSRRWYEYTGATPEESHGEGWMKFMHPEDRERMTARWQHSLRTGEPYEIEYRFRGATGEYRWFLGKANPLRNEKGEIVEWFGTATDISERKRLEDELEQLLARERAAREQVTNILESITDAFFAVNRDWRFTYVNREAERLLHRSREELTGRNLWDEFPDAVGATFGREYRRAMAEHVTVHFEERYQPLGIWVDVRAYPTTEGLAVYFRDQTARKTAEERLRESEERYRLLADMIPQHIWTTDAAGYHTYFSRRWLEYTGTEHADSAGEGWIQFLHPDDRERTRLRWEHSLRTGQPYSIEYRFRDKNGEYCWFWGQAMPLRDEEGNIVQWFGTLTDISERKRLDEERERLLQREREARAEADRQRENLERVTESRAGLLRGFSHDVRNPLTVADMTAQLLELESPAGEQRDGIERIRRSIRSSLRLIDDLLDVARAEAGQLEIALAPVDIGLILRELTEEFSAPAAAVGLELELRAPQGVEVETDPARVRQIVSNLLSNAVKYAPHSRVTVDATRRRSGAPGDGEWIAVTVADTGPGIPEDKKEAVFEEYTRLDPEAQQGAGIGLAISRRIARLLGGDLRVDSEIGKGATFTLWVPVAAGK